MARLLTGVTHAVVVVPHKSDAQASSTLCMVDLCFGPGDDSCISGIRYMKGADGKPAWQVPMFITIRDGRQVTLPVFKGRLFLEATKLASAAVAHIKKDLGESCWGKRYQVFKDRIVVEDLPKE